MPFSGTVLAYYIIKSVLLVGVVEFALGVALDLGVVLFKTL
jgi:hypothetical protein